MVLNVSANCQVKITKALPQEINQSSETNSKKRNKKGKEGRRKKGKKGKK